MMQLWQNIIATDSSDVKKSVRDAALFALGLFALKFLGGLDPHSLFANDYGTVVSAFMSGVDAVYSSWLALAMPMLYRTVRTGDDNEEKPSVP